MAPSSPSPRLRSWLMFSMLLSVTLIISAQEAAKGQEFLYAELEKDETRALVSLKEEKIWADFKQQKQVLERLDVLRRARTVRAIPLLVRHINYRPIFAQNRLRPTEQIFPVIGVLSSIGILAVPELVGQSKTLQPTEGRTKIDRSNPANPKVVRLNQDPDGRHKRTLIVSTLVLIYTQGGEGAPMARQRLELELKKTTGRQKELLELALKQLPSKE